MAERGRGAGGRGGPGRGGPGRGGGPGRTGGLGRIGLVGGVLLAVLLGWYAAPLVYPLRLFTVLLHEGGHAVATLLTGGEVVELRVNAEESGHVLSRGGIHFLILHAGYLGSLLAGLALGHAPATARGPAFLLSALALIALVWIPVFSFGFAYTLAVALALLALALRASHGTCRFVLRALGLFVVADAVRDILSDLGQGDAALLADLTGVPAMAWSAGWLLASLAIMIRAVRRADAGPG